MGKIDMKKIVRVRKLNDIEEFDWEITFEDDTKINHKHEHFFDLIEKGLAQLIKPEPKIENNPEHPVVTILCDRGERYFSCFED